MTTADKTTAGLALLRAPFLPNQISKLPKPYKKDSPKGKCNECGGWHGLPAVHLDYVGHAALTDRLLDADPTWTWEPCALDTHGAPMVDKDGGMWIKLTVCGVTRLGYGDAQGKQGGDAVKERIGDALRNAAMRFGCALDLWHKGGNLHGDDETGPGESPPRDLKESAANASNHTTVKTTTSSTPPARKDGAPVSASQAAGPATTTVDSAKALAEHVKAMTEATTKPKRFAALMAAQKAFPDSNSAERKIIQDKFAKLNAEAKEASPAPASTVGTKANGSAENPNYSDEAPPPMDDDIPF